MHPDNRFFAIFIKCVSQTMLASPGTTLELHEAVRWCLKPDSVRTFFMQEGYDGAEVTAPALLTCAQWMGLPPSKPLRTFADMMECLKQHKDGLVTDPELILALQCTPHQVAACVQHARLPYSIQSKSTLSAWDEDVAMRSERGDPPFKAM